MKIYRNGQEIELTEQEIYAIYFETYMKGIEDEVILKLKEDYNINLDKENIDIMPIAFDIRNEIGENDTISDCEQEIYHRVIKRYLEEGGIK